MVRVGKERRGQGGRQGEGPEMVLLSEVAMLAAATAAAVGAVAARREKMENGKKRKAVGLRRDRETRASSRRGATGSTVDAEGQEGGGGEEEEEVQGDSDRCVDVCMDAARGGGAEGLRTRKEVVEWYRAIREEARQVDGGGEEWLPADGGVEGGAV